MANKTMHHLIVGDDNYEIVDASVRGSMADEYSSSSTYSVGDFVMHNGQLYECNTTIGTAEAWNSSHWTAKTVANELSSLMSGLTDTQSDVSDLDTVINGSGGGTQDVTSSVVWNSGGGVEYQSGNIDTNASNYSWADIPLNGASEVSGYTRAGTEQNKGLCFLTSNKSYIAGSGDYHAGATSYDWNYDLIPPANAAYLRISCATSKTTTTFTCTLTFAGVDGLVDRVDNIENQLDAFPINDLSDVDISSVSDGQVLTYDALSSKWKNKDNSVNFGNLTATWIEGYYVNRNYFNADSSKGLFSTSSTQSMAIVDISAYAGGKISGHTRFGDDQGAAFYDRNGIFISGFARPAGTDYEFDFTDKPIPANAKTLIISCKTSSKSSQALTTWQLAVHLSMTLRPSYSVWIVISLIFTMIHRPD